MSDLDSFEIRSDDSTDLSPGPSRPNWPIAVAVIVILALIAAVLTFIPTYNKIGQTTGESWVPYFLAFQSGFLWEAALGDVM